jgi:hypothetical protein
MQSLQSATVSSVAKIIPSFPVTGIVIVVILSMVIIGVVMYLKIMREQPSLANLMALIDIGTKNAASYPKQMTSRKGLGDYLLTIGNLPAEQLAFSNFHVMTANLGGYFSPINKAALCKEAIQYAIQAGARCIVFDIWPNISKGGNKGPILAVRQNDDSIEIIGHSYYTLNLTTAFTEVRKYAFEDSANPANRDPMILYLRFRGKPTANTLNGTATALINVFQQNNHRLPDNFTFTDKNPLYSTPINVTLPGKIIILSDQPGTGTSFAQWVNNPIAPSNTPFQRKTIGVPGEIRGLTSSQLTDLDLNCTRNLMACAPLPEDVAISETNRWDWKRAHNAGIQFCAMNLWAKGPELDAYLNPAVFGTYSFMIKSGIPPTVEGFASRYTIERVPNPITVKPLGYGDGTVYVK